LAGWGLAQDSFHPCRPHPKGEGMSRGITKALKTAGINAGKIDYINAHGTSTPLNDVIESNAIKKCFGKNAYNINISSTKSMTGHCLGASGAIEAIASVMALKNDIIPPTINLENPDDGCDLNYTAKVNQKRKVEIALSNSMGFGGHNVTLGFKKYL
jgi:3-oxoacyl-[acyl-carrier-protein] synthase II